MPNLGIKMPQMGIRIKSPAKKTRRSGKARGGPGNSPARSSMVDALFTTTQRRLLGLLFGQPDRSFFATELIELTRSGSGAVQRELRRLADSGLLVVTRLGNQKHFQANHAAPVYQELRGIVLKTIGLAEPIKAALASLAERIQLAVVYGSTAKREDTASSDVDLLIVSDSVILEQAYIALSSAEQEIARRINVTLYTTEEFRQRREQGNPFIAKVLAGEHWLLMGNTDESAATR